MKDLTREWLKASADDLAAARLLLADPDLTNLVAFHAQQYHLIINYLEQ